VNGWSIRGSSIAGAAESTLRTPRASSLRVRLVVCGQTKRCQGQPSSPRSLELSPDTFQNAHCPADSSVNYIVLTDAKYMVTGMNRPAPVPRLRSDAQPFHQIPAPRRN
jgi:hypothetical protein